MDRYSNWPSVYTANGEDKGAKELAKQFRIHMCTFGGPDEIASDGGPQYTSETFRGLTKRYGIHHRVSSVAFPHSNQKESTLSNLFTPVTAMGKRTLRQWILGPLQQPAAIRARHQLQL